MHASYTAYTVFGALGEYDKLAAGEVGYGSRPRDLVSIRVDVQPVLDLLDPAVCDRYAVDDAMILALRHTACHRIVRHAVLRDGYRAIRAPSAAVPGEMNLMIYPESLHGRLRYTDGGSRIAINHGTSPLRP